jgi:hypothetical protein
MAEDKAMQRQPDPARWEGEGRPRNDLRLVMAAIRAGWTIDPLVKQAIIGRASRILANADAKPRDVARASSTLVAIERLNLDAAVQEDRMARLDAGDATDRVELAQVVTDAQLAAVARLLQPVSLESLQCQPVAKPLAKTPAKPKRKPK